MYSGHLLLKEIILTHPHAKNWQRLNEMVAAAALK
jgi:hypothetical protein